jgi:hypothetical protein
MARFTPAPKLRLSENTDQRRAKERTKLEIDLSQSRVMLLIFDNIFSGKGLIEIVRGLNQLRMQHDLLLTRNPSLTVICLNVILS